MRLAAYLRVSTDGQAEHGLGLTVQERTVRAWCRDHGHRLVAVYRDEGVSGSNGVEDREGLPLALQDVQHGKVDGLVVARLDRLARAITTQEAILATVWRLDGRLYAVDMGGEVPPDDPDDPMRTAMRQMAGVFAELDRRLVVKRLRDGRSAKAAAGRKATGSYAYGYAGVGKGRERDAAPVEAEQRAVKRIVALRHAGRSYREIAADLDSLGLKPRRAASWSAAAVRNVARREGAA